MNRLIISILFIVLVAICFYQAHHLFASDQAASAQTEPRKVSRSSMAVKAVPAETAVLQTTSLDAAINRFVKSDTYRRAQSAVNSGKAKKIDFTISISPEETTGGSCICAGGKGSLNGTPTNWPCSCDPPGCGTCSSSYRSN